MLAAGLQLARGLVDWQEVVGQVERAARELRLCAGKQYPGTKLRWTEAAPEGLDTALGRMSRERFGKLKSQVLGHNPRTWSYDRSDCLAFVDKLRGLSAVRGTFAAEALA